VSSSPMTSGMGLASRRLLAVVALVYLATVVAWFLAFPLKDQVKVQDVISEGGYLLLVICSYLVIVRLRQPLLEYGWPIFAYGLLIDFLDEFTLDKEFFNDPIEDIFNAFGLLLVTAGFYSSYRRQVEEIARQERSGRRLAEEKERLASTLRAIGEGVVLVGLDGVVAMAHETAAILLGRRLAEEKERLASTLRAIGEGVVLVGLDGVVAMANETAAILLGRLAGGIEGRRLEETMLVRQWEAAPGSRCDIFARTLRSPKWLLNGRDFILTPPNGRERTIEIRGSLQEGADGTPIGVVFAFRDVTEKRLLEAESLKAQRLRSLGILAGGVAHDFNNILSAVLNWANAGRDMADELGATALDPIFQGVRGACRRGKGLSAQLMGFARGGEPVKRPVDLEAFLREEVRFGCTGSRVQLVFRLAADLWPVEADLGQIAQVVHNVVLNAVQAMPEGGQLEVGGENMDVEEGSSLPLSPGRYVCLEFQDQGAGIATGDLERVFDPFFSTKEGGHGLGLALAFAIVQRHGGHMTMRSAVGRGTAVRVFLPATSAVPQPGRPPVRICRPAPCRLLLVDDDAEVLAPLRVALRVRGLEVETAGDGREAVRRYRQAMEAERPFAFVLMDLTMPQGVGGREATRELLALDPGCRCIATSGYHDDPVMAEWRKHGFVGAITKPFDVDELCSLLAELQSIAASDSRFAAG